MPRKKSPQVLKACWSETYARLGERVTLNASTVNAIHKMLKFQVYEYRRKSKILKEIAVPIYRPEVSAKWNINFKPEVAEYGNPEFRFKAIIEKSSRTSKTLYVPADLEIALTFDDGPAPRENPKTERILNILKRSNIKATFFVEHKNTLDKYRQAILVRMKKDSHEIGVHGVDPKNHHLPHQDTLKFEGKLKVMRELIKNVVGSHPMFIRPPFGWGGWKKGKVWNKTQLSSFYQKFNMIRVNGWEAEIGRSDFWKNIDRKIKAAALGNKQKLIILSHDLRDFDSEHLAMIVKEIRDRSNKIKVKVKYVTIKELLGK